MADKIGVMVVNDSNYMTKLLSELIDSSSRLEVCDIVQDGAAAIRKIKHKRPEVVVLDLEMPNMDGLTFIEQVMKKDPIPIVVVSSYSQRSTQILFDALELGAVDFVPIPLEEPWKISRLKRSLIEKIRIAARTNKQALKPRNLSSERLTLKEKMHNGEGASQVVVIGASTGGPRSLRHILAELPADLPAGWIIVQHMPKTFTTSFAQSLNHISKLKVKEARDGDIIKEGVALLAPGDNHLVINGSHVKLNQSPHRLGARPSVNMAMSTASEVYGANTVGVLLSGMGYDGAFGMKMIKKRGGITLAEDETSSVVFGMAKAARDLHAVDKFAPIEKLAQEIVGVVEKNA